jgi:AraC-like DNA-binding protein
MPCGLRYAEFPPPVDLAPWVACFWEIRGTVADGAPLLHRVLPDGCADLLFDLAPARAGASAAASLIGPMSTAALVPLRGWVDLLGLRLRPGALGSFAGLPARELLDIALPAAALPPALRLDAGRLAGLDATGARMALLVGACRRRLAPLGAPDALVRHALARWSRAERAPFPTVEVLTRDLGLSERAFERRFAARVGLNPVHYRRLARFRSVLRLHAAGARNWAALAAGTGFADQSHLARAFVEFCGLPPTAWAATQAADAGFVQDGIVATL